MAAAAPAPAPPRSRRRVWARRVVIVGAVMSASSLVGVIAGWIWLQSPPGNRWLLIQLRTVAQNALQGGTVEIGAIDTNVLGRIELLDVRLRDPQGVEVIGADRVFASYRPWPLATGNLRVSSLEVDGLVFDVRTDADGATSLHHLFGPPDPDAPPAAPWEGLPIDVLVSSVQVRGGRVRWATATDAWGVTDLAVRGAARLDGPRVSVVGLGVEGSLTDFITGPVAIGANALAWDGDRAEIGGLAAAALGSRLRAGGVVTGLTDEPAVDVAVALLPLDLNGVDRVLGGAGLGGRWAGAAWFTGPTTALVPHVDLTGVDGTAGRLRLDGAIDVTDPEIPWTADIEVTGFHAHHAFKPLATMVVALGDEVIVDGRIEASGHGTSWPDGVVANAHWKGATQRVFGMDFDAVEADVGLAGGVLSIGSLATEGPMGDLAGGGTIDLAKGPIDLHLAGPFRASELSRFGADGFGGGGYLDARFTGDPRAADPVYVAAGRIVATALTYGTEITVDRATADTSVRIDARGVRVTATVEGTTGDAYGVDFVGLHEPDLVVDYRYTGDLVVSGLGTIDEASMPSLVEMADVTGPWSYTMPSGDDGVFEAHLDVGPFEIVDVIDGDRGRADVLFEGDEVGFRADLWQAERSVVDTRGTFGVKDSAIVLDHLSLSPVEGYRYVAVEPVRLRLTPGGIGDATIVMEGVPGERVAIHGAVGTEGPLDARIEVTALDLGVVAALFPESAGALSGTLTLGADLDGSADEVVAVGHLEFLGTALEGQKEPLAVSATFDGASDRVTLDVESRTGPAPFLAAHGTVPFRLDLGAPGLDPDGAVDLVVDLHPGSLDRFADFGAGLPEGVASARVEARGPIRDPRLEVAAVVETPVEGWDAPMRLEIGAVRADGDLVVWGDAYEGFARRGEIDGIADDEVASWLAWVLGEGERPSSETYASYVTDLHAKAHLLGIPVSSVLALLGQTADADGRVEGDLSVDGSPDTPVIRADISWVDGHLGEVAIKEGHLVIVPVDNGYTVEADVRMEEGWIHVGGDVPIYVDFSKDVRAWGTGDLALRLEADGLPLAAVAAFLPDVADAEGYLTIAGDVTGPATDARPSMELSLVDGAIAYLPLGVRYHDIQLTASGSREVIDVTSLTLNTAPLRGGAGLARGTVVGGGDGAPRPDLVMKGRIGVEDWVPTDVSVDIDLARFYAVALPEQLVVLRGDASGTGGWPDVVLRGDLQVQSGYWRLDAATFLRTGPLTLDPRLVVHRGGQRYDRLIVESLPPFWHSFDVALGVEVTRNLEVEVLFPFLTTYGSLGASLTTATVNARLAGDLVFVARGGELDLRGEIEVIEGEVKVLRSDFDLQQGRITFQGDLSDPFLDLSARMEVSTGASVEMSVRGPTSDPAVAFSSQDYPSDSQILTILITGQPPDDLTATQGASAAQALMNVFLSSVLGNARIGSVAIDADGTVRVGLPLGRAYAEALYRLDPDLDENHYAVDYEIQLARRFLLDGTFGDRESILDLLWELRF